MVCSYLSMISSIMRPLRCDSCWSYRWPSSDLSSAIAGEMYAHVVDICQVALKRSLQGRAPLMHASRQQHTLQHPALERAHAHSHSAGCKAWHRAAFVTADSLAILPGLQSRSHNTAEGKVFPADHAVWDQ